MKKDKSLALTGKQVQKISGFKPKVLTYPELIKYNSIEELLGNVEAVIILYLTSKNYGHWCCLFKYPNSNKIEFFDSYGLIIDDELAFVDDNFRVDNNMAYPHLTYLLTKYDGPIEYNEFQLQDPNDTKSQTCGRHVGFRLRLRFLPLLDYISIFNKSKYTPDQIITFFTNLLL